MATTVNGQPVIFENRTTGPLPRLRKWTIPNSERHLVLRDGSMGFLLVHVALWFDEKIERLDRVGEPWDEWGWAVRPIRGEETGYSQHAGGVACDLNATKHPRHVPALKTFTPTQIRMIKRRMDFMQGLVNWGGEWRTPDAMHFEIADVSVARCEALAKKLLTTPRGKRISKANPGAKAIIFA